MKFKFVFLSYFVCININHLCIFPPILSRWWRWVQIHTSLINGRPGALEPTAELLNFTLARYVRLRLQKIRTLNADLMNAKPARNGDPDRSLYRRLFYSIKVKSQWLQASLGHLLMIHFRFVYPKDISIGGQCVCNGHAAACSYDDNLKVLLDVDWLNSYNNVQWIRVIGNCQELLKFPPADS